VKRKILVFGAPSDDRLGNMALEILQEEEFPVVRFSIGEEYKKNILIVFFTINKEKNQFMLQCAAHKLLHESVISITPLIIACSPKAERKKEEFRKAVKNIAIAYWKWGSLGFPMFPNNGNFPPWGGEPDGQPGHPKTARQKNFLLWKKRVEEYLKGFR